MTCAIRFVKARYIAHGGILSAVPLAAALLIALGPAAQAQLKPGQVIRAPDGALTLAPPASGANSADGAAAKSAPSQWKPGRVIRKPDGRIVLVPPAEKPPAAPEKNDTPPPAASPAAASGPTSLPEPKPHTPDQPALTLVASPVEVAAGMRATLRWRAANATSCTATGGWTGPHDTTGEQITGPLSASTSFFLTCQKEGRRITRSARITVTPPPVTPHPLESLPPGQWYAPPDAALTRRCATKVDKRDGDCRDLIGAWNGAAYDTSRDRLLVWGGGFNAHAGNEVYAFDVKGLAWLRLTEPSVPIAEPDGSAWLPGDAPNTHHSIDSLAYLPGLDAMMAGNGFGPYLPPKTPDAFRNGGGCRLLALRTRQWTPCPFVAKMVAAGPSTGPVYGYGRYYSFHEYDPQGGTVRLLSPLYDTPGWDMTAAFDSKRRTVVAIGAGKLLVYDPARPPPDGRAFRPTLSGDVDIIEPDAPGFEYVPAADRFYAWSGGASVYEIDPATWHWRRIPPAAGNRFVPPAAMRAGTFGRFRYIARYDAFIVVNEPEGRVYFWKRAR